MNANAIRKTTLRELTTITNELEAYREESDIWKTVPGISNSAGTLALHVAGSVQHFIGADLGKTGYKRDREAEFSRRDAPRSELIAELNSAAAAVDSILPQLTEDDLAREFPERVGGISLSTAQSAQKAWREEHRTMQKLGRVIDGGRDGDGRSRHG